MQQQQKSQFQVWFVRHMLGSSEVCSLPSNLEYHLLSQWELTDIECQACHLFICTFWTLGLCHTGEE